MTHSCPTRRSSDLRRSCMGCRYGSCQFHTSTLTTSSGSIFSSSLSGAGRGAVPKKTREPSCEKRTSPCSLTHQPAGSASSSSEEHTSGTPVTNAHLVCGFLLDKKHKSQHER